MARGTLGYCLLLFSLALPWRLRGSVSYRRPGTLRCRAEVYGIFSPSGTKLVRRSSCRAHGRPRAKRFGRLPKRRGSGSGARRAGYPGPPRGFCQTGSRGSGASKLPEWIAPGRGLLHLVAPIRTTPVFKQTCTHVQVCASVLFFWTVHGPFSFRQDRKENGGWNEPATIVAESPVPVRAPVRPSPQSFPGPPLGVHWGTPSSWRLCPVPSGGFLFPRAWQAQKRSGQRCCPLLFPIQATPAGGLISGSAPRRWLSRRSCRRPWPG